MDKTNNNRRSGSIRKCRISPRVPVPFAGTALAAALRIATVSTLCSLVAAPLQASLDPSMEQAGQSSAPVGQVTLALGKAWVEDAGGSRMLARLGMPVRVSDTITTASGGHVHVRFVDDALVSVRPSSVLEIVRYEYDPARPADSAVKLNLLEGETRAISGAAAEHARQNFRLNTPIAAIGVRGTDFSVVSNDSEMRVTVTQGAVIVAPFSGDCLAEALGPCSATGLEFAMNSSQILQFSTDAGEPVLLPVASSAVADTMVDDSLPPPAANAEQERDSEGELYVDSVGSRAVNQEIAKTRNQPRPEPPAPPVEPPVEPPVIPTTPAYTPPELVSEVELVSNTQLVWGRYAYANVELERITVDSQVAEDLGFEGTVGNNLYALYRLEPDGRKLLQPGLGALGFTLSQAQAVYKSGGGAELMSVLGGQLNIDFGLRTFSTSLQLDHAATGAVTFSDSGRIFDYGNFHSRGETQNIYGSVSTDGSEAGYYFDKVLENGTVEGLTLWGKQP